MPFDFSHESIRLACPEPVERLTMNGINHHPLALSLSKGLVQDQIRIGITT